MQEDVAADIDVTPFASAIVEVMLEPYLLFIARLVGEGRVTEAEIEELNALAAERAKRISSLVKERLAEDEPSPP